MIRLLRLLFFAVFVRPLTFLVLGLNIRGRKHLPVDGPAIIVANHNSHLDTLVLMSLFPLENLRKVHPVAAADYFLTGKFISWFSQKIIGIIPLSRKMSHKNRDPFSPIKRALDRGEIIIFFPEGSRGSPEEMTPIKSGIAHLVKDHPHVPIVPVFLSGLGKALPKGDPILVPFHVDVKIGEPIFQGIDRNALIEAIREEFESACLAKKC